MEPERTVHYADSGDVQIAYQVIGDGPLDIVMAFDWASNIDLLRWIPPFDRFTQRIAEFGRLIVFDMRGAGLSDPVDRLPSLEVWVDDVQSVMDAAGSKRAALIGNGQAAQLALLFAAMHPRQTTAVVTVNGFAYLAPSAGLSVRVLARVSEERAIRIVRARWGTGGFSDTADPGFADLPDGADWSWRRSNVRRHPSRSRAQAATGLRHRHPGRACPTISVPTLVAHSKLNRFVGADHARYLVDHICRCPAFWKFRERDHVVTAASEDADVSGGRHGGVPHRRQAASVLSRALKTVAFTDIVGSTEMAVDLGDSRWRGLLETHESVSRRVVDSARGQVVKFTGDGVMATFDGPARAVQCMRRSATSSRRSALPLRAGVHTGEVELIGDDIGGIAVHVAARIAALAGEGEVLTSSTVRDLVAGSGLVFEDRGEQMLKGVPEPWRVFAATSQ